MKSTTLATLTATAALLAGCATKTRSVDLAGMYVSDTGTLAIGSVEVQSSPEGVESAAIRYSEDTAWLSPSTKTHAIKILLTGTNAVASAEGIVSSICNAFTATASLSASQEPLAAPASASLSASQESPAAPASQSSDPQEGPAAPASAGATTQT